MDKTEIYATIARHVIDGDSNATVDSCLKALDAGLEPLEIINDGLSAGINKVGELFGAGEYFLPELIVSADAMKAGAAVVNDALLAQGKAKEPVGKVVIGSVKDDEHDIGKNIVASLLTAHGFLVTDLGTNVPQSVFVEKAREMKPDIVGLSALLTTTMPNQKSTIEALEEAGLRRSLKVIIGGAPVTAKWAESIGADAYARDAVDAVEKAKSLVGGDSR
ncbi:MAG: corrinoid protein [Firmicutes bacterium]|nr:corrinoid protein [Bacillota bacterium]